MNKHCNLVVDVIHWWGSKKVAEHVEDFGRRSGCAVGYSALSSYPFAVGHLPQLETAERPGYDT